MSRHATQVRACEADREKLQHDQPRSQWFKKSRETYLGLVTTEVAVFKTLKTDRELNVLDEWAVPTFGLYSGLRACSAIACVPASARQAFGCLGVWR